MKYTFLVLQMELKEALRETTELRRAVNEPKNHGVRDEKTPFTPILRKKNC